MKTTVELPDELLIAAKKRAAETRTSLRAILERALRRELIEQSESSRPKKRPRIRWVTFPGGLSPDLDVSDRAAMHDWLRKHQ